MKKMPIIALLLVMARPAFSADFGILFSQIIEAEIDYFAYSPTLTPWLSWEGKNGFSLYLSGHLSFDYYKYSGEFTDSSWDFEPELSHFALNYINERMSFEAGRIEYTDIMGYAAYGLFDGLRIDAITSFGIISVSAFYTGLLFKETAKIIMTENDILQYLKPWDFDNFDGYYASRRVLAALRLDLPVGKTNIFSTEVLAQFDLNDSDNKLHSQYCEVQYMFYPINMMRITAAALLETMQDGDGDLRASFGALAQVRTEISGGLNDWFDFTVKFTSGSIDSAFVPFFSMNYVSQGAVFPISSARLALLEAGYNVKIANALLAGYELHYFIRTFNNFPAAGTLYGGELWTFFTFRPSESIRLTFGAGAFFPRLGNVYPSDTDTIWRLYATLTLAL